MDSKPYWELDFEPSAWKLGVDPHAPVDASPKRSTSKTASRGAAVGENGAKDGARIFSESDFAAEVEACRELAASLLTRPESGFARLPQKENLWTAIDLRAREVARNTTHMVVVGMGGSSLGGQALLSSCPRPAGRGQVSFLDNIDADHFWTWLRSRLDLGSTHWVIISKSGNTIETLALADQIDQHLRASGHRRLSTNATVISETRDNPLTHWARREGVPILEIPSDVGGRYSVLSAVGGLPAAYAGLKCDRLVAGAKWTLENLDLVARLAALGQLQAQRGDQMTMLWSYAEGLRRFGFWWQQLWAESLAKPLTEEFPYPATIPVPCVGACDQHSVLQQAMQGGRPLSAFFIRVAASEETTTKLERSLFESQSFLVGKTLGDLYATQAESTRLALQEQGVPTAVLRTKVLDERSLGALFMLWEMAIAVQGLRRGVNPFDQPGVERGKQMTLARLSGSEAGAAAGSV